MRSKKGFTLIELSIVLAIIGLIVGGIFLTGRSTVDSAKTAQTLSIIKETSEAMTEFKAKYKSLPGDMKVTSEFPINDLCKVGGANAGNDDGVIDSVESPCVIDHMYGAAIIRSDGEDGSGRKVLNTPFGQTQVISPSASTTIVNGHISNRKAPVVIILNNLPCDIARTIDRKTDDDNITDPNGRAIAVDASGDIYDCPDGSIVPHMIAPL